MVKTIDEIKNKEEYLEFTHKKVRQRTTELIKDIITYCKNLEVDFDNLSVEDKGRIKADILDKARAAMNCMEIASILFEYDTMANYRLKNKDSLKERVEELIESYELGTHHRY